MSAAESGKSSGQGAPGPDGPGQADPGQADPTALVEDINRTRAELGDTVEALVARVDVKARAQQRAAAVTTQAKGKLQAVQQQLAGRASQLTGPAKQARPAAAASSKTVLGAGASTGQAVQRGAHRVTKAVGRHQAPVAAGAAAVAAVAAVLTGWLVVRRRRC